MALIQCPECRKEISDTIRKCPNCGFKIKSKKNTRYNGYSEAAGKSPKKIKLWQIFTVIVVISFLAGGTYAVISYVNSPVKKVVGHLADGDINAAQEIFSSKIKNDSSLYADVQDSFSVLLSNSVNMYAEDNEKYERYTNLSQFVKDNYPDYDISDYENQITELQDSKNSYDNAKSLQEQKNYIEAISTYEKVIEKDKNYEDSQIQIETCKNSYKNDILSEIDQQLAADVPAYEEISKKINSTDYLKNDSDITGKMAELKEKFKNNKLSAANSFASENKYVSAFNELSNIPEEFTADSAVTDTRNNITASMLNWVLNEASKLAKEKKYDKAVEFLYQYKVYDTGNTISTKMSSYEKKAKKAVITEFKNLKSKLTIQYDSVDQDYNVVSRGYQTKYINISGSVNIEARAIVDKKKKFSDFSLIVGFQQDDWIFTELVKFACGKYRATYVIDYSDRYTQVLTGGGGIAEWMYLDLLEYGDYFDSIDKLISKITTSKKATIRFSASGQGSRNHTITSKEKENIKTVYRFYQLLDKYDYLYKYI